MLQHWLSVYQECLKHYLLTHLVLLVGSQVSLFPRNTSPDCKWPLPWFRSSLLRSEWPCGLLLAQSWDQTLLMLSSVAPAWMLSEHHCTSLLLLMCGAGAEQDNPGMCMPSPRVRSGVVMSGGEACLGGVSTSLSLSPTFLILLNAVDSWVLSFIKL